MPKVSVIIPTYNRADMVGDAIASVIGQTYSDWELIIIDDGSTDATGDVVAGLNDQRIRYHHQENRGLPGARNAGIRRASGEYVAFLDSDDLFLPHKLEAQVHLLDGRKELGVIAGGYREVDERLNVLREVVPWHGTPTLELEDWILNCPFPPSIPLTRRSWLERVGLFDETMSRVEDWDLWLRMSYAGCRMDWYRAPTCLYRIHGTNMVRSVRQMRDGMLTMLDKLYAHDDLPREIAEMRDQAYSRAYLDAAARAYAIGAIEEGKDSLQRAVTLCPALLTGDPPRLFSSLASFARTALAGDSETFMKRVAANLPEGAAALRPSKRSLSGLLHAVAAFEHYQSHRHSQVLSEALSALAADKGWLYNRGFLSITARSFGKLFYPQSGPRSRLD